MICAHCQNVISKDLQAATGGLSVCIACATAISNALQTLPTKPNRRQEITMQLNKLGLRVSAIDRYVMELAEYGETDDRIRAAFDIAKRSCANPGIAYIASVLRNERASGRPPEQPKPEAEAVAAKPVWAQQGFVSEEDENRCLDAWNRSGRRKQWKQFKGDWLGVV